MSPPLDGCLAKISRAKQLIEELEAEIFSAINDTAYKITGEHEFAKKRYVFRLEGPHLPLRISVLAGEVIHHLRSTLDHLVWAVANKEGIKDSKARIISFPVCDTKEKFVDATNRGVLSGVPEEFIKFIESIQPYQAACPENSIVKILHDLDIVEKHRLLVLATQATRMGSNIKLLGELTSDVSIIVADSAPHPIPFFRAIEQGREVHWLSYETSTQPMWRIENDFSIVAVFERVASYERIEVIPVLKQMCSFIEEVFSIIKVR